jgi:integrase
MTAGSSRRIRQHERSFRRCGEPRISTLTAREVAQLSDACRPQGDVVAILAYTGLKFGELTGLNVEDVDLAARRIRVRRCITQVGGRLVEGNPKSDAGRHSVPIPERLVPALKARLDRSPAWVLRQLPHREARDSLWRTGREQSPGRRRSPRSGERGCACTIYAIPMRRCRARRGPLRLVQKAMGHPSITVTAHTYADHIDDELDNIAAALDSLSDDLSQST